jgi:ABC-2 type transport system permease protein
MLTILQKEINSFFSSLIAYIVISVFLTATGLFVWILPGLNVFQYGYATLDEMFNIAPWVFMFLIPAITMRLLAEEQSTGTLEILTTKPLSDGTIVTAKFLAGLVMVIFSVVPTLIYFYSIYMLADPVGNVDVGGTMGSYLGLLFLGGGYTAIGLFGSSLTKNQIIAFIISIFICFLLYALVPWLREYTTWSAIDPILKSINIQAHYRSMSRGVIDTRDVVYFLSLIVVFLMMTKTVLESRKW